MMTTSKDKQAGESSWDPLVKWSIVGIVMVIALVLAVIPLLLPDSDTDSGGTDRNAAINTTTGDVGVGSPGETSAGAEASPVARRPDCPAQGVAGVNLECLGGQAGKEFARSDVGKEMTVVNLWAWWCQPCRAELPVLEQFAAKNPQYQVVGVHADKKAAAGADLLNDLGVTLPSYQDSGNRFAGALGLPSVVPITVLVRGGRVVATLATPFESLEQLSNAVSAALKGEGAAGKGAK